MPGTLHPTVEQVTARLRQRSAPTRQRYLDSCRLTQRDTPPRQTLSCGNLAHGYAACGAEEKRRIGSMRAPNLGIITAYNDMLSAHQPLAVYPDRIKQQASAAGGSAQVAAGVPAMCDGVTQGQPGMELSLFSRDVVAMATAVGFSHNLFDAGLCLGICDKIVPGMLIGALQFGHLPIGFIGSGPMGTGIANSEKAAMRQNYAAGKASRAQLLAVESASYHSPGTCTFYGTANTNQLMVEALGLQLPGSSFLHPTHPLRPALTARTVTALFSQTAQGDNYRPLCEVVTEASLVNAVVALLASGGSTNHTLHLVAIAGAAGIQLQWRDIDELSRQVPLLARVYPNGEADINDFQAAGGTAYLLHELRRGGLLNEDVNNLLGSGLAPYCCHPEPAAADGIDWRQPADRSLRDDVLARLESPFAPEGGLRSLSGNLGEAVIKVSAVAPEQQSIEAPCRVFESQQELLTAFAADQLNCDVVAVVRFQGPAANGMPELHQLTPCLGVLQDRGFKVALVTDGRMSGASGKVPAAIHLMPEAVGGGPISRLQDGDIIALDARAGTLNVLLEAAQWDRRPTAAAPAGADSLGRRLFRLFRQSVNESGRGATVFADAPDTAQCADKPAAAQAATAETE